MHQFSTQLRTDEFSGVSGRLLRKYYEFSGVSRRLLTKYNEFSGVSGRLLRKYYEFSGSSGGSTMSFRQQRKAVEEEL